MDLLLFSCPLHIKLYEIINLYFCEFHQIYLVCLGLEYPLIPDHLHYGSHKWTQDILLVAKPGTKLPVQQGIFFTDIFFNVGFEIEIREPSDKILPPLGGEMGTSGYAPAPPKPRPKPGRSVNNADKCRLLITKNCKYCIYRWQSYRTEWVRFSGLQRTRPGIYNCERMARKISTNLKSSFLIFFLQGPAHE